MEKSASFETVSKRLENFLYVHAILHKRSYVDRYGMTTWVYDNTPELQRVVDEFVAIEQRRKSNPALNHTAS